MKRVFIFILITVFQGKNYETYYGLVRGNWNNQSKAIDNDGNIFFIYIQNKI